MKTKKQRQSGFLVLQRKPDESVDFFCNNKRLGSLKIQKIESTICKAVWQAGNKTDVYIPKATFVEFKFNKRNTVRVSFKDGSPSGLSLIIQATPNIKVLRTEIA